MFGCGSELGYVQPLAENWQEMTQGFQKQLVSTVDYNLYATNH